VFILYKLYFLADVRIWFNGCPQNKDIESTIGDKNGEVLTF